MASEDEVPHILSNETVDNTIAELIIDTRSEDIKSALRIYQFNKSIKQLEREFTRLQVSQLRATLAYLNADGGVEYLKHELVNNLICRIQNLLPEKCNICNTIYCTKNGNKTILPCSKCGQEAHKECIFETLQIKEDEEADIDHTAIMRKLNPHKLNGFHYLCKACEEANIPAKTSARKNKTKPKKKNVIDSSNNDLTQEQSQHGDIRDVTISQDIPSFQSQSQFNDNNSQFNDNNSSDGKDEDEGETNVEKNRPVKKKVCRFYRIGTCQHGVSGKNCDFEHPKMCNKLLKHGTKQPRGCNLGKNCDQFHPKMCSTSIAKLECFDRKCQLRHVKGTRRERDKIKSFSKDKEKLGTNSNKKKGEGEQNDTGPSNGNFLDALRQLKSELLEAVDTKLAIALSQFNQQPQLQEHPHTQQTHAQYQQPQLQGHPYTQHQQSQQQQPPLLVQPYTQQTQTQIPANLTPPKFHYLQQMLPYIHPMNNLRN